MMIKVNNKDYKSTPAVFITQSSQLQKLFEKKTAGGVQKQKVKGGI
jgi:hypothetical protein